MLTRRRRLRIHEARSAPEREFALEPPPAERKLDCEAGLATLPRRAKDVLVLHDIEGYTHEEIGVLLGVTAGTSKSQLHRARSLLRSALAADPEDRKA